MSDDDPYGSPYQVPDTMPPIVDPGAAAAAASQAGHFAQQHREAIGGREKEIRDIQEKQQLNVGTMTQMLDDTIAQIKRARSGQSNLPLITMGGAMMSSPGNFGQQVGHGFLGLASGIKNERDDERETTLKLADLNLKRATISNMPLEQRLAYMKALQTGDIAALARIEAMQVKAQAGGAGPAAVKEFNVWKEDPANAGKTFADYQRFKAGLTDRGTALQREYDLAKQSKPDMKWEEFLQEKSRATAAGHAQGTAQATAAQSLPAVVSNTETMIKKIDDILNMPNLDNLLGWGAMLPNRPEGPGRDLENAIKTLQSQGYLQGFEGLKGAGPITDQEGNAAKDALMRLDPLAKPGTFKKQLEEARDKIKRILEVKRQQAGRDAPKENISGGGTTNPTPTPPEQTGQTQKPTAPAATGAYTGPRAKAADGSPLIVRDGKWVPE